MLLTFTEAKPRLGDFSGHIAPAGRSATAEPQVGNLPKPALSHAFDIFSPAGPARKSRLRSVSIYPGAMAFTEMPCRASSSADVRVSWLIPAFDAA